MTNRTRHWLYRAGTVCLAAAMTTSLPGGEPPGEESEQDRTRPSAEQSADDDRGPADVRDPDQPTPPRDRSRPGRGRAGGRGERRLGRAEHFSDQLGEEERQRVLDFLDGHFPEAAREYYLQLEQNPRLAERKVHRLMPEMLRLMRSYDQDPLELFNLRVEEFKNELGMRKIMRLYRRDGPRREELRRELRGHLEHAFDVRQSIGRMEIERLERGIARLRERLERDAKDREQIIERDLERRLAPRGPGMMRPRGPGGATAPAERPEDAPGDPDEFLGP
ncbi:MAG: hypothetical protein JSV19_02335 [Phycisphaerales bacterium]|nr:MAG: hypothetical protein JSV19_02335 [Phycisphaerales bacterium]